MQQYNHNFCTIRLTWTLKLKGFVTSGQSIRKVLNIVGLRAFQVDTMFSVSLYHIQDSWTDHVEDFSNRLTWCEKPFNFKVHET